MKTLRAYLELVRLPNAFTAAADALAGYWLARGFLVGDRRLAWLIVASVCLYCGGIVLNDLRDVEIDRRERPGRPLPSGRVSRAFARRLIVILLGIGLLGATLAGSASIQTAEISSQNRGMFAALALIATIAAYDLQLKSTILGPPAMGLCRALNLAMPLAAMRVEITNAHAAALLGMFLYVTSLTYFGRDEAGVSLRRRLALGGIGILSGLIVLGFVTTWNPSGDPLTLVIWLALAIQTIRCAWRAWKLPEQPLVQHAMKTFILGIIAFDAVIASAIGGWQAAAIVLALLIPPIAIGRRLYST
jgi:4-hydroxybenzoate polyprenyltransferase